MGLIDKIKIAFGVDSNDINSTLGNDAIDYNYYEYGDYQDKSGNIFFGQNTDLTHESVGLETNNKREFTPMIEYGIESGYMKVNTKYIDDKAEDILKQETKTNPNLGNVIDTLDGKYPGRDNRDDKIRELSTEDEINKDEETYIGVDNILDLTVSSDKTDIDSKISQVEIDNIELPAIKEDLNKPLKELKIKKTKSQEKIEEKIKEDIDTSDLEKMADDLESEKLINNRLEAFRRRKREFNNKSNTIGGVDRRYESFNKDFEKYKYQISITDYKLYKEYSDIMSSNDKDKIKRVYPIVIPRQYNIVDFVGFIETESDMDVEPVIVDIQIVRDKADIPLLYGLVFEQIFNNFGKFRIDSYLANELKLITVLSRVLKCPFQNNQFYYGYLSNAIMNRIKVLKYPELNISYKNKNTKDLILPNKGKSDEEITKYNQMSTTYEFRNRSKDIKENKRIIEENNIIKNSKNARNNKNYMIDFDNKEEKR